MQGDHRAVQSDQEREDQFNSLGRRTIEEVLRHLEIQDHTQLANNLELMHAADITALLEQLSAYDARAFSRV